MMNCKDMVLVVALSLVGTCFGDNAPSQDKKCDAQAGMDMMQAFLSIDNVQLPGVDNTASFACLEQYCLQLTDKQEIMDFLTNITLAKAVLALSVSALQIDKNADWMELLMFPSHIFSVGVIVAATTDYYKNFQSTLSFNPLTALDRKGGWLKRFVATYLVTTALWELPSFIEALKNLPSTVATGTDAISINPQEKSGIIVAYVMRLGNLEGLLRRRLQQLQKEASQVQDTVVA